jgi:low affinity Fe/Cu permease
MQKSSWKSIDRFEGFAKRASNFVSGPLGTHIAFGLLAFWLGAALVVGWTKAYDIVEEIVTISSFLLLFLLQRSQAKATLAMQVKPNELLAAVNKASPQLINLRRIGAREKVRRSMTCTRSCSRTGDHPTQSRRSDPRRKGSSQGNGPTSPRLTATQAQAGTERQPPSSRGRVN